MDINYNIFILTLQPNIKLTTLDIGVIKTNLSLNEELAAGILLMAHTLWGDDYIRHIQLELVNPLHEIYLYQPSEYKIIYQVVEAQTIIPYESNTNWFKYINILASNPSNIVRVPKEINMRYTCRLINRERGVSAIYQFDSNDFIRGAISLCSWLNISWNDYIDYIHKGPILYNLA